MFNFASFLVPLTHAMLKISSVIERSLSLNKMVYVGTETVNI